MHGFTLVELLVVIAILVLLIGLTLPSVMKMQAMASRQASLATLATIDAACKMYQTDHKVYPPSNSWNDGRKALAQCLLGHRDAAVDGADGFGFRLRTPGKLYGPYLDAGRTRVKGSGADVVLVDTGDNEVYYYVFREGQYHGGDCGGGPGDINNYAKDSDGNYFKTTFILCTKGPDGKWTAYRDNVTTDDVTNFLPED